MGKMYSLTCSNKSCRYNVQIREGPGMRGCANAWKYQCDILSGKIDSTDEIKQQLANGARIDCWAAYLCPSCKEWQSKNDLYIFVPTLVSPYGTIRDYKVYYPLGNPKCEKCGTDMIYIFRPRSSKNKCPKCGSDMRFRGNFGFYD